MDLFKTKFAEERLATIKKIDVDEIFAQRYDEYGIAGAFGHLHAVFSDTVRKMEQVVADLRQVETEVESLQIAAEKVLNEDNIEYDEPIYTLLYSASAVVRQMIEAKWLTTEIVGYDIKDEELAEERLIPKDE